jgi:hypothetical protein
MVCPRHGARTDSTLVWRRVQVMDSEEVQGKDPLADTSSYVPSTSIWSRQKKSFGLQDDTIFRQAWVLQLERSYHQRQVIVPPHVAPTRALTLFTNPTFLAQLVKAIVDTINSTSALIAPVAPVVTVPTDNMVTVVWIVKSIREMRCDVD